MVLVVVVNKDFLPTVFNHTEDKAMSLMDRVQQISANDRNELKFVVVIVGNVIKHPNDKKYCNLHYNRVHKKLNQKQLFMDVLVLAGFKKTSGIKPRLIIKISSDNITHIEVAYEMLSNKLNELSTACNCNNQSSISVDSINSTRLRYHSNASDETEEKIQYEKAWKKKNKFQAIPRNGVRCNGDCGSGVSKIIENCLNKNDGKIRNWKTIIRNAFSHYQNPARRNLVNLMQNAFGAPMKPVDIDKHDYINTPLTNGEYPIFQWLKDQDTKINDKMCEDILELFAKFVKENKSDILQELANCTCRVPEKSLYEEIADNTDELKQQLKSLELIISYTQKKSSYSNTAEKEYTINMIKSLNNHSEYIQKQLNTIKKTNDIIKTHESLLQLTKQTPEYGEMKARNHKLTDLEIMAVLFYCNQDFFCHQMRKSHRLNINSCRWKQLYFLLCSAINKMYLTFYYKKNKFEKINIEDALYHGSYFTSIHETNRSEISLNTVTSFTKMFAVAVDFAANNGMVLILTDVENKLKSGELRGADVGWFPIKFKESEFMILPTTFKKVTQFTEEDQNEFPITLLHGSHVEIYKTDTYKSQDLKCLRFDLNRRVFLNKYFDLDDAHGEEIRMLIFVAGVLIGPFVRYKCLVCNIKSRFLYFSGSIMDMTAECPVCRHQFLQIGNNRIRDEFLCRNTVDCGMITHSDLRALNSKDIAKGKNKENGYICTKCKKQQVTAEIYSLENDPQYLEDRTKYYKDIVERFVNKDCENGQKHLNIDLEVGKQLVLWLFKNKDATFFSAVNEFSEIYDWFLSVPSIKKAFVKLIRDYATKRNSKGRFGWQTHIVDAVNELINNNTMNTRFLINQNDTQPQMLHEEIINSDVDCNDNTDSDLNIVVEGVQGIVRGNWNVEEHLQTIGNGISGLSRLFRQY